MAAQQESQASQGSEGSQTSSRPASHASGPIETAVEEHRIEPMEQRTDVEMTGMRSDMVEEDVGRMPLIGNGTINFPVEPRATSMDDTVPFPLETRTSSMEDTVTPSEHLEELPEDSSVPRLTQSLPELMPPTTPMELTYHGPSLPPEASTSRTIPRTAAVKRTADQEYPIGRVYTRPRITSPPTSPPRESQPQAALPHERYPELEYTGSHNFTVAIPGSTEVQASTDDNQELSVANRLRQRGRREASASIPAVNRLSASRELTYVAPSENRLSRPLRGRISKTKKENK